MQTVCKASSLLEYFANVQPILFKEKQPYESSITFANIGTLPYIFMGR